MSTEQKIWQSKVHSWEDFLESHHKIALSHARKHRINMHIRNSMNALDLQDYGFFNTLPGNLHWRLYNELQKDCCFLDIETTGLDKFRNNITVIGLYNGQESKFFVQGKNLHEFGEEIKKYHSMVTFNGRCFDAPFIQAQMPKVSLPKFHIDLRFAMKELGFSGGLKRIERQVGIQRDDDLAEVDGYEAVRLWYKYKKGDADALELLLKYNQADIENLKTLMDFSFGKLKEKNFLNVVNR